MFPIGVTALTCTLYEEVITVNIDTAAIGYNTDTVLTDNGYIGAVDGYVTLVRTDTGRTGHIQFCAIKGNISGSCNRITITAALCCNRAGHCNRTFICNDSTFSCANRDIARQGNITFIRVNTPSAGNGRIIADDGNILYRTNTVFPFDIAALGGTLNKEIVTVYVDTAAVGDHTNTVLTDNGYICTLDGYIAFVRTNACATIHIKFCSIEGNISFGINCVIAITALCCNSTGHGNRALNSIYSGSHSTYCNVAVQSYIALSRFDTDTTGNRSIITDDCNILQSTYAMFPLSITTLTCTLYKEVITVNRNAAAVSNNTDTVITDYGYTCTVDGYISFIRTDTGTAIHIQLYSFKRNITCCIDCKIIIATFDGQVYCTLRRLNAFQGLNVNRSPIRIVDCQRMLTVALNFKSIITLDGFERYVLIYKNRSVLDQYESIAVYKIAGKIGTAHICRCMCRQCCGRK